MKAGLPVEITQEFDNWRKIRDSEGAEGWVFHSLLSGKRTALVAPWETSGNAGPFAAHQRAGSGERRRRLSRAEGDRQGRRMPHRLVPRSAASGYRGWIEQDRLWGVYPNEEFKE